MGQVQVTFTRTCEYVATVDTAEVREVVGRLPGSTERDDALIALDQLEGQPGSYADWLIRSLGYLISNTETGRDYLGGIADSDPGYLAGTGAPEITDLRA